MSANETQKEKTGALFFLLTGIPVLAVISALFAFAGFLAFIPYLNLASAVLLTPAVCILFLRLFSKNARMEPLMARALTAAASLAGAYSHICVMAGVLTGVYGTFPVEIYYMRYTELPDFLQAAGAVFGEAARYLVSPVFLWQDIFAWGEEGWPILMAAALFAQIGLPQLFVRKRPGPDFAP